MRGGGGKSANQDRLTPVTEETPISWKFQNTRRRKRNAVLPIDKTDKLTAGYASEMVANKPKLSHESEPFRKIPIL